MFTFNAYKVPNKTAKVVEAPKPDEVEVPANVISAEPLTEVVESVETIEAPKTTKTKASKK